ncbi:hypothetical protein ABID82_003748 [Methylobacterium sp. PvP062]|jgi:hypothetical protein|uniref:Transcriptional regulator n=2 Tax=Methylobacterium radiotolerans TaxID=31998 RepID=B1M2Q7_METRJ|nr:MULTISPECIES: hypothetical protein [Methylobacterium]MCX7332880.1 hypothetical protein [Hyphomicrobiales bacterium]MCY4507657.1 hypothetical protein [Acidobacteriota bacterium]GAN48769.1 hypothetical protein ME121_2787 [Methylobacterium sp. ME121]ACB27705.1 hypothetical protein Mrad2831_5761 [Methylobacterium radiotolerans JCM 2831]KIU37427.1 hypothetical protein SR39_00125 [Methylobacterium radiotolerans]
MTDDATPPTTRWLLERIAATLNVCPTYFLQPDRPDETAADQDARDCAEVAALFRSIKSPARRNAVLNLLREMSRET